MTLLPVITAAFRRFVSSGQSSGVLLFSCTVVALALANSPWAAGFESLRHAHLGPLSVEHWINDVLMAVFFLLVGLELEREIQVGELSNLRSALLPLIAAAGGMLVPAGIHYAFNAGLPTQPGFGVPMATDIAFSLAILSLLGPRIPPALKVFVVAFAVADDLGAVALIAFVYTADLSPGHLLAGAGVFAALLTLNRGFRVMALWPYLLGGVALWYCLFTGGVHASVAGVLLAFAIPFTSKTPGTESPSQRLENRLHVPVGYLVLPLFALANTAIAIDATAWSGVFGPNGLGILLGLVLGKPVGIALFCVLAVRFGPCRLPEGTGWFHVIGAGLLGGIGFTMSIFISNLAFAGAPEMIESSKLAVLCASAAASLAGFAWLAARGSPQPRM